MRWITPGQTPRGQHGRVLRRHNVGFALSVAGLVACVLGSAQRAHAQQAPSTPAPSDPSQVEPSVAGGQGGEPAATSAAELGSEPAPAPGGSAAASTETAVAPPLAAAAVAAPQAQPPLQQEPQVQDQGDASEVASARERGPFSARQVRVSVLVGTGSLGSDDYLILGAGVGYFLVNGLELGLDYQVWMFGDPTLHRLSPGVRYVLTFVPVVKPYVGAFYRHNFIEDYDDFDQVGARAGVYILPKGPVFVGAGAVYERTLECDESVWSCDSVYPEVMIGASF